MERSVGVRHIEMCGPWSGISDKGCRWDTALSVGLEPVSTAQWAQCVRKMILFEIREERRIL